MIWWIVQNKISGKGVREPVPLVTEGDISVDDEREQTEILPKGRSSQGGGYCDRVTLTPSRDEIHYCLAYRTLDFRIHVQYLGYIVYRMGIERCRVG